MRGGCPARRDADRPSGTVSFPEPTRSAMSKDQPSFKTATLADWQKAAAKSAPGGDVNALNWLTPDGITVKPLYTAADVQGLPHAEEAGGLSGAPVREASNRVVRQLRAALGAGFPIIGVGGILSGADAQAKIEAGADVVQIYTGLIYKGAGLVREVAQAIRR